MTVTLDDLIGGLERARRHLLRHLRGVKDAQWDWKPYPEAKSLRETLQHLVVDDRAALESLRTGEEPDYEKLACEIVDIPALFAELEKSRSALLDDIRSRFANAPLDADLCIWGAHYKLAVGLPYLSSEDFYHAGQIAFIRNATDPSWDYYAEIYGGEE